MFIKKNKRRVPSTQKIITFEVKIKNSLNFKGFAKKT